MKRRKTMKKYFVVLMFMAVILPAEGSAHTLPKPSGKYFVSVHYLHFTDENRIELFDNDLNRKREITVKGWYPTDEKSGSAPYLLNADFAVKYRMMPEMFRDLKTNSGRDLPVSTKEKKFPVLIFSHGFGEHFSQNSILMEELASHGYIIFSIAHHFECRFSFYPNGRVIHLETKSRRFQKIWKEMQNPKAMELHNSTLEVKTNNERMRIFKDISDIIPTGLKESPKHWAKDTSFFLDQLEVMNKEHPLFKNVMNLDQIGVFGMSMGGIAACETSLTDKRVKAGVNIDGGLFGSILNDKLQIPFLFVNCGRYLGFGELFTEKSEKDCYSMSVKDSGHYNFTDYSIYPTPLVLTQLGAIDGKQTIDIMNVLIPAFFDKYLRGKKDINLLKLGEAFPEIETVKN
jgi:hypothetical protein